MNISQKESQQSSWIIVAVIISIVLIMFLFWKYAFSSNDSEPTIDVVNERLKENTQLVINEEPLDVVTEDIIEEPEYTSIKAEDEPASIPEPVNEIVEVIEKTHNVELDESDSWVKEKLTEIIWRKELLTLFVNEDRIRRFVVFIDNFSQGNVSYNNSPVVKPLGSFIVENEDSNEAITYIDESNYKRFTRYVELLDAVDVDLLVEKYDEFEPLLKSAYSELGYPDDDFKEKLLVSINKVLDIELPKDKAALIRPSVMYKYENEDLERLDDAEKLMLRMGKENLLLVKSILLELNEKLAL